MKTPRFAVLISLVATLLVGCSSSRDVSYASITRNLTPELDGTTERPVDIDLNLAVSHNTNLRMLNDDIGRFFYTDHPSRLSPFPITYRSGRPR